MWEGPCRAGYHPCNGQNGLQHPNNFGSNVRENIDKRPLEDWWGLSESPMLPDLKVRTALFAGSTVMLEQNEVHGSEKWTTGKQLQL